MRHMVGHRGHGAVGHVDAHGQVAEQLQQRDGHLALARAFRAEDVQYGEETVLRDDDVPEQRGEVETYSGYGVVSIDFQHLVGEIEEADVARPVDELPLELEQCVLLLVERGEGGNVVVLPLVFHHAQLAERAELAVNSDAVRPGEEALLLPTQLCDLAAGLRVVVEIGLYLVETVVAAFK